MGGVVKNVVGAVEDVVEGAGDIVQDVVIDPVVELGSNLEDGIREVVDEADKLVQNPYVQTVVSVINPAAGAFLNAYATLDSGENLSPAQVAALAASGYTVASGTTIPPDVQKALDAGTAIAEGGDAKNVLLKTYGSDFVSELGLDTQVNQTLANTFGQETVDLVRDNIDYAEAAARVVQGEDPSVVIADKFGQDIVDRLGVGDPAGYAALKTAVALDQGADTDDALLAGAEDYYRRGGELPDASALAGLAGIEDFNFDPNQLVADLNLNFDVLQGQGYNLGSLKDYGINLSGLSGVELPQLLSEFNIRDLPDLGFDVAGFDLSGYKPTDLGFEVGEFGQLQDLGINVGDLDLSDYNLPELADLNIDLQIPELDLALQQLGQPPSQVASLDMDTDLTGEDTFEAFEQPEITRLSRRLLESTV